VGLLALPAIAWGGETAPGSTETLALKVPNEREVGKPMTVTVQGTADGLHRLFVYGQAGREEGCDTWPYEQQAQIATATLTGTEGEALGPGPFVKSFVVVPANPSTYLVCAYLDTTPSSNPDVFEYGCYVIPATPANNINCYRPYAPWWVAASAGKWSQEQVEKAERQRREEAEAEQIQLRAKVEAAARQANEEAERRRAIEASERKAREAALRRCAVPELRRHTLAGVRRLLRGADCRLGRVTIRHHGDGTLVVKSQTPRPGKTLPPRSAISIVLGLRAGQP
jgi:hypothetical protein